MDCKLQKPGLHTETLETEHFKVEVMRNDGKVMAMRILRDDQWLPFDAADIVALHDILKYTYGEMILMPPADNQVYYV